MFESNKTFVEVKSFYDRTIIPSLLSIFNMLFVLLLLSFRFFFILTKSFKSLLVFHSKKQFTQHSEMMRSFFFTQLKGKWIFFILYSLVNSSIGELKSPWKENGAIIILLNFVHAQKLLLGMKFYKNDWIISS
jgi:hypothetical protein